MTVSCVYWWMDRPWHALLQLIQKLSAVVVHKRLHFSKCTTTDLLATLSCRSTAVWQRRLSRPVKHATTLLLQMLGNSFATSGSLPLLKFSE